MMEELKYFVVIEVSPWNSGEGYKYSAIVDNQKHYYIWSADELKHEMMEGFYQDGIDADGVQCTATYYNIGDDPMFADPVETVECWIDPEDCIDPEVKELAQTVRDADCWDDDDVQDAMRKLCYHAYTKLSAMPESHKKTEIICQILNELHEDDSYLSENPHIIYDFCDITEERVKKAVDLLWDYDKIHCEGCDVIADIFQKILGVEL